MTKHKPVLLQSAVDALNIKPNGVYIDVTLGGGGHSKLILEQMKYRGRLIVFDLNSKAIDEFKNYIGSQNVSNLSVDFVNQNFRDLKQVLDDLGVTKIDGILADLGLSTDQIETVPGISYIRDEELDMRLDTNLRVKASDLLNGLYYKELLKLFTMYGDVKFANELAKEIVETRKVTPIISTNQLKSLIQKVVPQSKRWGANKNPEAKVFQALRIAVNDELNSLRIFLPLALEALRPEGRLVVITFHSGEDRIVKQFAKDCEKRLSANMKEIVKPTVDEIKSNKRSESAKLRIITKL